jgi:hypothetical protein
MAAPRIDLSRYPLVVVTFVGLATEAEFDAYLAAMTKMINERKQKNVVILDATQSGRSPPSQRKKQARWIKEHEHLLRAYSFGTAFVITSALVRGVLTAIFWVQPLPNDYTIVATLEEAERWAAAKLRDGGSAPGATTTS